MKILCVDCKYVKPEFAGAWLLIKNGRGLFIECNTSHAIPLLLEAATREGLTPDLVDGLVATHIHLDHAGGAGEFLQVFPQAVLYAHPRAARHAIDPSRLISSASAVYGEARLKELYGEIRPCPAERVKILNDGDSLFFQGVKLGIRHVRGHANHHLTVFEPETRTLFTGDSAGVTYPAVNRKHGLLVLASTSPTDFDGKAALEALEWMEAQAPDRLAPTHFGFIEKSDFARVYEMLRDELRFSMEVVQRIRREKLAVAQVERLLGDWLRQYWKRHGVALDEDDWSLWQLDLQVNAQGLWFAASKDA